MRRPLEILAGLLLAIAVAAPVSAATPGGASTTELTGTLERAYLDGFGETPDVTVWTLRTANAVLTVDTAAIRPSGLAGAVVTLTGTRSGATFIATAARRISAGSGTGITTDATTDATVDTASATVAKSVAVVMFNFDDLAATPYSKAEVLDALTGTGSSVKRYYEEESKGRLTVTGAVFGWYHIAAVTSGCNWTSWGTMAEAAANAAGANLSAYTNVIYVWPGTSQCQFSGIGYVPGTRSGLNGTLNVQVATHELGHNFGLSHSNALHCTSGGSKVMIAAPASCTT
ncbi:MAG: hypothetical protein WCK58_12985, partial [Chloroflexota bacterium]